MAISVFVRYREWGAFWPRCWMTMFWLSDWLEILHSYSTSQNNKIYQVSRKYNSPFLSYDVIMCQICRPMPENPIFQKVGFGPWIFLRLAHVAKLPINKVVFVTFLLNQQNAFLKFFSYQKIGWRPCDKNMIAAPPEKFFKKFHQILK